MAKRGMFELEWIFMVGLFLALAVMGMIAALATPYVMVSLGKAKSDAAGIAIERLSDTLDLYRSDVGDYPSNARGLEALIEQPPEAKRWNGPYVKKYERLTDPWGRPYRYRYPGEHGNFDLYSLGKDGRVGGDGEDRDVTSR